MALQSGTFVYVVASLAAPQVEETEMEMEMVEMVTEPVAVC